MCEPCLSIIQIPAEDPNGTPISERVDAILPPEDTWDSMKKRIGGWFHFSHAGFGHSEILQKLTISGRRFLPEETKYESKWWIRSTHIDGYYRGEKWQQSLALDAANDYSIKVATGNMTVLRQFLQRSILKTQRPRMYIEQFSQMLTKIGRGLFLDKIRKIIRGQYEHNRETIIKIACGFTRKRRLLVPEWSDDNLIWS